MKFKEFITWIIDIFTRRDPDLEGTKRDMEKLRKIGKGLLVWCLIHQQVAWGATVYTDVIDGTVYYDSSATDCSDVTADDTASTLQGAITAAGASGVIYGCGGTYAPVSIAAAGVHLIGPLTIDNMTELSSSTDLGGGVFSYPMAYNPRVVIYDGEPLELDDNATTTVEPGKWDWNETDTLYVNVDGTTDPDDGVFKVPVNSRGVFVNGVDNVTVDDATVLGAGGVLSGIHVYNSNNSTVQHSTTKYCAYGIQASHAVGDVSTGVILFDNDFIDNSNDIFINRSTYATIDENTIQQTWDFYTKIFARDLSATGIILNNGSDNVSITQNLIETKFGEGMIIDDSDNVIISSNSVGHTKGALVLQGTSATATVTNNTLAYTISPDNGYAFANDNSVTYYDRCLQIADTSDGHTITDNTLVEDQDSTYTQFPLSNSGSGTTFTIDSNLLYIDSGDVVNWVPAGAGAQMNFAEWQAYNGAVYDQHSFNIDPLFLSATDYRLRANSPARYHGSGPKYGLTFNPGELLEVTLP